MRKTRTSSPRILKDGIVLIDSGSDALQRVITLPFQPSCGEVRGIAL